MNALIILCAQYLIYVSGLIAGIYWLTLPNKTKIQVAIFGIVTGIVAVVLAKAGGSIFYDARPFVADHVASLFPYTADNGFPSDHTLIAAVMAVTIYSVSKKLGLGLLALAIIIGVSRVLANVHHPLDIIGSLIFAGLGGVVAYYLVPRLVSYLPISKVPKER